MFKSAVYLRIIPLALLACMIVASTVYAGENDDHGTFGISAAFGGGSVSIMTPIWSGQTFVLVPAFGVVHSDASVYSGSSMNDGYTRINFNFLFRFNLSSGEAVPYIGFRAGAVVTKIDEYVYEYDYPYGYPYGYRIEETYTDGLFGLAAGGEYFLRDRLSVGVEGQLNLLLFDSESAAIRQLNTMAVVIGTFYF